MCGGLALHLFETYISEQFTAFIGLLCGRSETESEKMVRISDESLGVHAVLLRKLRTPLLALLLLLMCIYFRPRRRSAELGAADHRGAATAVEVAQGTVTKTEATDSPAPMPVDNLPAPDASTEDPLGLPERRHISNPELTSVPDHPQPGNVHGPEIDNLAELARLADTHGRLNHARQQRQRLAKVLARIARRVAEAKAKKGMESAPVSLQVNPQSQSHPSVTELLLRNPAGNRNEIAFLIDGEVHRLAPGKELRLEHGAIRTIRFHRGGNWGESRQSLETGEYEFHLSPQGWELVTAIPATE
jgi:hypothetical protein